MIVALLDSGLLCAAAGSDRPDSCTLNQIVILGSLGPKLVCTETPRAALPVTLTVLNKLGCYQRSIVNRL